MMIKVYQGQHLTLKIYTAVCSHPLDASGLLAGEVARAILARKAHNFRRRQSKKYGIPYSKVRYEHGPHTQHDLALKIHSIMQTKGRYRVIDQKVILFQQPCNGYLRAGTIRANKRI